MSLGTRFRNTPEAHSSRRSFVGAALVGAVLAGSSAGVAFAQDATPEASAGTVPAWVEAVMVEEWPETTGDRTAVTVVVNDEGTAPLTINAASFEARPIVALPTYNANDYDVLVVIYQVPNPIVAYVVPAGTEVMATFPEMATGTYVLTTDNGYALSFTITEPVDLGVPDIFAEGTPEATPVN